MERGCFEPLCFPPRIFLYSTVFLKLEEQSKPGHPLVIKGSISSLPLKDSDTIRLGGIFVFQNLPLQQWR